MMLYLMQHGDAVSKDVDPNRPLSETGRAQIRRVTELLESHGHRPSHVFHSGKLRATQTAEIVATSLAPGLECEEMAGLGPNDPPDALIDELSKRTEDMLLVSHMPLVGRLVNRLVGGAEGNVIVAFLPGSIACLERGEDQCWVIDWFLRPDIVA